ncbi:MAG: hypothetical protein WC783_00525 [Candidatus Paceibacterota bacterium]|jgi:hypothetical protein
MRESEILEIFKPPAGCTFNKLFIQWTGEECGNYESEDGSIIPSPLSKPICIDCIHKSTPECERIIKSFKYE